MKKQIALASTLAILGTFSFGAAAHAGAFADAFKSVVDKIKESGKKFIKSNNLGAVADALKAKAAEWKEKAAALKGKALKQWGKLRAQAEKHLGWLQAEGKKIKLNALKQISKHREKIRAFWEKAKGAVKDAVKDVKKAADAS